MKAFYLDESNVIFEGAVKGITEMRNSSKVGYCQVLLPSGMVMVKGDVNDIRKRMADYLDGLKADKICKECVALGEKIEGYEQILEKDQIIDSLRRTISCIRRGVPDVPFEKINETLIGAGFTKLGPNVFTSSEGDVMCENDGHCAYLSPVAAHERWHNSRFVKVNFDNRYSDGGGFEENIKRAAELCSLVNSDWFQEGLTMELGESND